MKIFNKFTILFVGIVISLLCIMMIYVLCIDFFGWDDLTGLKHKFHVTTLGELLERYALIGVDVNFIYLLFILFLVLGIAFVINLRKHRFWTHGY